jgi:hypothetical protein
VQVPLQPLADNLESQTYEVFEKDPVKYVNYQEAVFLALQDMKAKAKGQMERVIIMVVGAGRGPLVRASLAAAERAQVPVLVYAIDKNPNAVVTLRCSPAESHCFAYAYAYAQSSRVACSDIQRSVSGAKSGAKSNSRHLFTWRTNHMSCWATKCVKLCLLSSRC